MNERLVAFLQQTCALLSNLTGPYPSAQLARERIAQQNPETVTELSTMLEEARELCELYDDLPQDEDRPFSEN